ncbi:AAA family ATPase [Dyella sp. M7H15-1]|uniref:IS21-like element helper ATPase IstB n=1 Tax=Dyella sp. M7H15-1 TaxID=2501295 RepID=UPI0010050C8D|nr:IS21-like element helper ATPase IstB [Dyella sp. M7H15-1]QAU22957.1 AAA family ATPase [Dyella sp. M7H15-1]QAU23074.1 AAA family ATPase [Dyella sp. M7H15-1]QAU23229.1 AAA family ATPase [Dyella sp. M7H15-1]QAU23519.1 AAA family ATPase [Dyella sp. M7H15-1]QAU23755.1 AAA family ATPase [Dyella sp. M7H15-1]
MLIHPTLEHLRALKLDGMAQALEEQRLLPACHDLPFEDRLGMLVDRERHWRDGRRQERLLRVAKLKHAQACLEDVQYSADRGIDKRLIATLSGGDWIRQGQSVLLTGPTGVGKTWLACALGQHACRQGFPVLYQRVPRLAEMLRIAHADGSFGRVLAQLARIDVLILDDWGMTPLDQAARHDLLEVIDDRGNGKSTLITSQLPIEHWHAWLNDPTLADAILDRLVHRSHRIVLKGESMRRKSSAKPAADTSS